MRLFLASASNTISLLESKLSKDGNKNVLFIANASDSIIGDKWWVEDDRKQFMKMNWGVINIDLREIDKKEFVEYLKKTDIIHFSGGSVLYLISLIKEKGFDQDIVKYVKEDKIIYSGTSAGSIITSNDLCLYRFDDEERDLINNMKDYKGLGLVDFLIFPHSNNKDITKSNLQIIEHLSEAPQSLIFLDDNKAVWVEDSKFEIVGL